MSAPASSYRAVLVALAANLFVTVVKFIAFFASGSGAMLSEAIHSAADAGNQFLLFLGLRRGMRERDQSFHYGYGSERFVFGILSASGIFFVGSGVTVYHGLTGLLHPHQPEIGSLTFVVLGLSLLIEGGSMAVAFKAILGERQGMPVGRYLKEKADPAALAILLEDSAAVLGLLLAAGGIALAYFTGNPIWDSLGSIVVGLILGLVAIFLVIENRALLLGKAVPAEVEHSFVELLRSWPSIREVRDVKTLQLTPEVFRLKAEIMFQEAFLVPRLEAHLPQSLSPEPAGRARILAALSGAAVLALSDEIDRIEEAVRGRIPQARHIDLEVDHTPAAEDRKPEAAIARLVASR